MLAVFAALLFAQAAPLQSTPVNPSALPSAPAIALDPAAREDVSVNTRALGYALLEAQMWAYFASEKKAAWWWAGTGVTALLVGGALGGVNTDASRHPRSQISRGRGPRLDRPKRDHAGVRSVRCSQIADVFKRVPRSFPRSRQRVRSVDFSGRNPGRDKTKRGIGPLFSFFRFSFQGSC
jgi:hypothetical protein